MDAMPQGFRPQFEAFAIYDAVKLWYFDRLQRVLADYYFCISKLSLPEPTVMTLRANALTLFEALREKIGRQAKDKTEEALVDAIDQISKHPSVWAKPIEGDTLQERFEFWAGVVGFEVRMLDRIGITKIDMERKDKVEEFLLRGYNKSK